MLIYNGNLNYYQKALAIKEFENMVNNLDLLRKYMLHIESFEGITYTSDYKLESSGDLFTEEEKKTLQNIAENLYK